MVCNSCMCEIKPDTIVQTWRNSVHKIVNSNWESITQDERLYDKLLWAPILDVFEVFGPNFPISRDYLNQLQQFIKSVTKAGEYPSGSYFDKKKVEKLNNIKKYK